MTEPETDEIPFDNNPAFGEGWGLFSYGEDDNLEIQRLDIPSDTVSHLPDTPIFESDEKALEFVKEKAELGSAYHQDVLSRLNQGETTERDGFAECTFRDMEQFRMSLHHDREQTIRLLMERLVEQWLNDGRKEVISALTHWATNRTNLGDDDVLCGMAEQFLEEQ